MQTRRLGQTLEVSALGMGAMGLSFGLGPTADKQEAIKVSLVPPAASGVSSSRRQSLKATPCVLSPAILIKHADCSPM
jgi:hypothetical protein